MKLSKLAIHFFLLLLVSQILFYKCANKVPPSGGPRDTIPPSLIYSNPKHQSINVHSRVYEFTFDERIQLKNFNKQLVITPRIDFDYNIKYGKTGLILVFDEDFKDSTTYAFNFREGIQDLTEGNPTEDNKFTFSTGEYLDSLSIEGYITSLLTNDSIEDVTIGLYQLEDTVTIFDGSPYYFAESDEHGYYKLENIKNGKYLIYAFADGNKNLKLETKNERYGWYPDTLDLQENIEMLKFKIYNLDLREFRIVSALPSGKNFDINFNKYITEYFVHPLDTNISISSSFVKEHKSIRIYNNFENPDSTGIVVQAFDSVKTELIDTTWVKFIESSRKPDEFTLTLTPKGNTSITENFSGDIELNKPFLKILSDSILFRVDTVVVKTIKSNTQVLTNSNQTKLQIRFDLSKREIDSINATLDSLKTQLMAEQKKSDSIEGPTIQTAKKTVKQASNQVSFKGMHLYLGKGAIITVENDSSERMTANYKFINPEEYGNIKGSVLARDKKYIIQLLDRQNKIVKEIYTNDLVIFHNIQPGDYRLRIMIDENNNGQWDLGNMAKNEYPEPVYFYTTNEGLQWITVRANWDITDLLIE